ncbi:hypothetical protein JYU15_00465 [bacterium AH-315-I18]|nr:hypothetical protein [bacterium AH-315-I18]
MLDRQRTDRELDALADLYLTDIDQTENASQPPEGMAIDAQRQASQKRRQRPAEIASDTPDLPLASISTRSAGLMTQQPPARLSAKVSVETFAQQRQAIPAPEATPEVTSKVISENAQGNTADQTNQQNYKMPPAHHQEPTLRLVNHELETAMTSIVNPVVDTSKSSYTQVQVDYTSDPSILEFDESVVVEDRRAEIVFLGNLPGFASPWMTQYAQHVALECGIVGVLHIDDEQIDLDFVTTPANRNKLNAVHRQVMDFEQADNLLAVLELLNQAKEYPIGAWLIHLASPLTATTQVIAQSLATWTLLSGVDEAAGARAMDWLKQCLETARPKQMDHVQFMAMGADIDRAVSMVRQIDDRALEQHDTTVELVGVQRQMVPVHLQTLGSFPTLMEQWPVVIRLVAGLAASEDHRKSLVTRIDPAKHQSSTQQPEAQTPLTDEVDTQDNAEADAKAQELLLAARLAGVKIQGVELEETQVEDAQTRQSAEPMTVEDQLATGCLQAKDIATHAVPSPPESLEAPEAPLQVQQAPPAAPEVLTPLASPISSDPLTPSPPQPEVVSGTVQQFVERLKQQELRKRQQTTGNASEPDSSQQPPQQPNLEPQPMTVAQVAHTSKQQHEIHAHIVSPQREQSPAPQQPIQSDLQPAKPTVTATQTAQQSPVIHHLETQAQTGKPQLASYLSQAGVMSLTARCPQHPKVELVLDEAGGLHLLAEHQLASGESTCDALYALLDARGWVDQHVSLLSLTQKQLRFDMQIRPVVHLFTDDARGGAAMVANCARFVKLHLLAPVSVGKDTTYYCTELN